MAGWLALTVLQTYTACLLCGHAERRPRQAKHRLRGGHRPVLTARLDLARRPGRAHRRRAVERRGVVAVVRDHVEAAACGAALAGRDLTHTLIRDELIRRIARDAAATAAVYLHILRIGLRVLRSQAAAVLDSGKRSSGKSRYTHAAKVRLEQRLLVHHIGGRVDHVASIVGVDAVRRACEEKVRDQLVEGQRDAAGAVSELDVREEGKSVPRVVGLPNRGRITVESSKNELVWDAR